MKKWIAFLLCLMLTAALISCKMDGGSVMKGTVTAFDGQAMLVTPVEGSPELRSADCFAVPIAKMDTAREPQVGDTLEISYDGGILETYPAGLSGITAVRLAE